ncbi:MAG TPA: SusC/RagA family protein, partial [Porphyromonadaceae bacterium]|nr:SusC/RagA family protein [Porphyromonadaceae bacterium]
KTKDWLVVAPQLASFGTGAPYINGGDVENKGMEFAFTWNDKIREFQYGANLNFTYNKNKVTRLANTEGIIHGDTDVLFQGSTESYRAQVGNPIGFFYGYQSAGIFQTQQEADEYKGAKLPGAREGDVIWVDRNKDGEITPEDRGMIGNPHPDWLAGLNLNASYKGFDLSVTMNGVFGNQIMRSYRSWSDSPKDNYTADIFDRWHGEGTSNRFPRLTTNVHTNRQYVSDLYVEDGDYFRMQNITLGYDFKKLFPRMILQQARIYVTAQNLFTVTNYTGMDPEVGYGHGKSWVSGIDCGFYPSPRTYILGVNLKF